MAQAEHRGKSNLRELLITGISMAVNPLNEQLQLGMFPTCLPTNALHRAPRAYIARAHYLPVLTWTFFIQGYTTGSLPFCAPGRASDTRLQSLFAVEPAQLSVVRRGP